jgi:ribonuclease HI
VQQQIIKIFTDGSCHTQQKTGAWAAILLTGHEKTYLKGIADETTHNRMELLAVIHSIDFVNENHPGASMIIYTDSQYVVRIPERKEKLKRNHFLTKKDTPIQNPDLIQNLILLTETHDIQFVKVEAHQKPSEIRNNQEDIALVNIEVDKLARELLRLHTSCKLHGEDHGKRRIAGHHQS